MSPRLHRLLLGYYTGRVSRMNPDMSDALCAVNRYDRNCHVEAGFRARGIHRYRP